MVSALPAHDVPDLPVLHFREEFAQAAKSFIAMLSANEAAVLQFAVGLMDQCALRGFGVGGVMRTTGKQRVEKRLPLRRSFSVTP